MFAGMCGSASERGWHARSHAVQLPSAARSIAGSGPLRNLLGIRGVARAGASNAGACLLPAASGHEALALHASGCQLHFWEIPLYGVYLPLKLAKTCPIPFLPQPVPHTQAFLPWMVAPGRISVHLSDPHPSPAADDKRSHLFLQHVILLREARPADDATYRYLHQHWLT